MLTAMRVSADYVAALVGFVLFAVGGAALLGWLLVAYVRWGIAFARWCRLLVRGELPPRPEYWRGPDEHFDGATGP